MLREAPPAAPAAAEGPGGGDGEAAGRDGYAHIQMLVLWGGDADRASSRSVMPGYAGGRQEGLRQFAGQGLLLISPIHIALDAIRHAGDPQAGWMMR